VRTEWLYNAPEVELVQSLEGTYKMCAACAANNVDSEALYKWMGKNYCLRHFITGVVGYDRQAPYTRPDPLERLASERELERERCTPRPIVN